MKVWVFLFESREEFIAKQSGNKLMQAYNRDAGQKPQFGSPIELVQYLSKNTDPKAIQWVSRQYSRGAFHLQDLPTVKQSIAEFNRVRPKLEKKDLNAYKTTAELHDAIHPHGDKEIKSGKQQSREDYSELFSSGQAKMIYRGKTLSVVSPRTEKASCELGKGTKWCTAATDSDNAFSEYHSDEYPLYIIRIKKGEKYQLKLDYVFGEEEVDMQLMDAQDVEVDLDSLEKKHPELTKAVDAIAKDTGFLPWIRNPTAEDIVTSMNHHGNDFTIRVDPTKWTEELLFDLAVKYPDKLNQGMIKHAFERRKFDLIPKILDHYKEIPGTYKHLLSMINYAGIISGTNRLIAPIVKKELDKLPDHFQRMMHDRSFRGSPRTKEDAKKPLELDWGDFDRYD